MADSVVQAIYYGGTGNDTYSGGAGGDRIDGRGGADSLSGGAGNDSLLGGDCNDTLLGGDGVDTINGESGDDLAYGGANGDSILGGSGNDTLYGDAGNDTLDGGAGLDMLIGAAGNDYYTVTNLSTVLIESAGGGVDEIHTAINGYVLPDYFENLFLGFGTSGTGNALNNVITGYFGTNWLDGAGGTDTLIGASGNDTYVIDGADKVVKLAGEGIGEVRTSVSCGLADFVENLVMTGTANLEASGNALGNSLTGNSGNNLLNGDGGSDTMTGGVADDTYYVQSPSDVVVETAGQGKDLVVSWVSYALGGTLVENLTLLGPAGLSATGNSLGNTLTGNDGNNTLNGLGARDVLIGGLGADTFLFTTNSGRDRIDDFSAVQNDRVNVNAYTGGVANAAMVVQAGADVVITLTATDVITVLNATRADVLSHMVW